jgi:hypothetical protein
MRSSQVQGNPGEGSDHWEVRAMGAMEEEDESENRTIRKLLMS